MRTGCASAYLVNCAVQHRGGDTSQGLLDPSKSFSKHVRGRRVWCGVLGGVGRGGRCRLTRQLGPLDDRHPYRNDALVWPVMRAKQAMRTTLVSLGDAWSWGA